MTKAISSMTFKRSSMFTHFFNEWNKEHGTSYKNETEVMKAEGLAGFNEMQKYITNAIYWAKQECS